MNMAAYRGVYLWEVAREGASMTMKAAGNSLELLQACAEKTGCALEVLSYGGLPVFLGRFGRRQVWTAGLLFFAAGLYLMSSFVWVMRIEGNEPPAGKWDYTPVSGNGVWIHRLSPMDFWRTLRTFRG